MDKDELTREEIEALGGDVAPGDSGGEPLDALRTMHEEFAGRLAAALGAMLRTTVAAKVLDVRSQTFGKFVSRRESSVCSRAMRVAGRANVLLLDVAPAMLDAMMARLLGGDPSRFTPARRPPTEIERRLARRVMNVLVAELQGVWRDALGVVFDPTPAEDGVADDRLAPPVVFPPDEAVVVIALELSVGRLRGPLRLCVPCRVVEHVGDRLRSGGTSTDSAGAAGADGEDDGGKKATAGALVELRAELARMRIAATAVLDLSVGDIIATDRRIDEPLVVDVDGRVGFHARPGTHEGKKAIQIEDRIEPS